MDEVQKILDIYTEKEKIILSNYENRLFIIKEKIKDLKKNLNDKNKKILDNKYDQEKYVINLMNEDIEDNVQRFRNVMIRKDKAFFIISHLVFITINTLIITTSLDEPLFIKYLIIFMFFIMFSSNIKEIMTRY